MIARLRGLVDSTGPDFVVIDVAGVGYLVSASSRTLAKIGGPNEEAVIYTEMLVSDDSIRLVGFASAAERDWFRLLISVQGVGARVALSILSALSTEEVEQAIAAGDSAIVSRAQGVGPKLAQRIVNELKDKVGAIASVGSTGAGAPVAGFARDAASALVNLGFRPAEATAAVARAQSEIGSDASLDALVRAALRKAS